MTDDTPPEPSFRYRRWYTYGAGLIYSALLALILTKIAETGPLKTIALCLIGANLIREGFYMAGASLNDWIRLTRAWRKAQ